MIRLETPSREGQGREGWERRGPASPQLPGTTGSGSSAGSLAPHILATCLLWAVWLIILLHSDSYIPGADLRVIPGILTRNVKLRVIDYRRPLRSDFLSSDTPHCNHFCKCRRGWKPPTYVLGPHLRQAQRAYPKGGFKLQRSWIAVLPQERIALQVGGLL